MLPQFVVIGAMKAGTTSLYAYLDQHPGFAMPATKELDYFVREVNWERGRDWYERQFAHAGEGLLSGDISPNYTKHPHFSGVPERMAELLPDAKLVYVLRDPIARMRSHWIHAVDEQGVLGDIGRDLVEDPYFRECSSYAMQLERYLQHYPLESVLLVTAEDLRAHRDETLGRVLAFLGADADWRPRADVAGHPSDSKRAPRRGVPRAVREAAERTAPGRARRLVRGVTRRRLRPEETRLAPDQERRLRELLRPDMERLSSYMPAGFDGWGILR